MGWGARLLAQKAGHGGVFQWNSTSVCVCGGGGVERGKCRVGQA